MSTHDIAPDPKRYDARSAHDEPLDDEYTLSPASFSPSTFRVATTKPRAEIEAEKASKPRPDLLPPGALAWALPELDGIFACFAAFMRTRDMYELGEALGMIADLCPGGTRAQVFTAAGEIMGVGLRKHGPCTWRIAGTEQADPQTHYASAIRHLLEHAAGIERDPDSGKHPLLHAVCQISIMINLLDDPPAYPDDNDGRAMIGRPK